MKGVKMRKTIVLALVTALALTTAAQESRTASLVVANCCESKVDALLLPKLKAVLATKLSKIGLKTVNPDFFKDKADKAHGRVTVSVWQLQDSKTYIGVASRNHRYSIRMEVNLADARTGATVCGGAEVNTNSPSYSAEQVSNHGQKYIDELIDAAAADCARQWKNDLEFRKWIESPPPPILTPLPPPPPVDPQLTLTDTDGAIQKLVSAMRTNPIFRSNYDKAQKEIERAPLVIVGGLVDLTGGKSPTTDVGNLLGAASQNLRMTLLNSGLFDAKDDALVTTITKRIIASGNSPTEDGELMAALKQHGSPDFYMVGDLRYFDEPRAWTYRFRLAVHNLHTGKIVWEGTETIAKNKGKAVVK